MLAAAIGESLGSFLGGAISSIGDPAKGAAAAARGEGVRGRGGGATSAVAGATVVVIEEVLSEELAASGDLEVRACACIAH